MSEFVCSFCGREGEPGKDVTNLAYNPKLREDGYWWMCRFSGKVCCDDVLCYKKATAESRKASENVILKASTLSDKLTGECEFCHQDIQSSDGCIIQTITFHDKEYDRVTNTEDDGRCPDCNANFGEYHHFGCTLEDCPNCGKGLLGCPCGTPWAEGELEYPIGDFNDER